MKATFIGYDCDVVVEKYGNNGRAAITLIDSAGGGLVAIATVNLPGEAIAQGEVIVKDYSENEGMLAALTKAGVVSEPIRFINTGFVICPVCRLLT
jgi:hypothetical protein